MTDIIVKLDDKELPMIAIFSNYKTEIEVESVQQVPDELDSEGNVLVPAHEIVTHSMQPNPLTLVDHITNYFNTQKELFLKRTLKQLIETETKKTKGKLEDSIDDGPLYEAIKEAGLENMNDVLRSNV